MKQFGNQTHPRWGWKANISRPGLRRGGSAHIFAIRYNLQAETGWLKEFIVTTSPLIPITIRTEVLLLNEEEKL
jgi:hypothetical protein